MPQCAEVNLTMQSLTEVSYNTSEQHKDSSKSRIQRDRDDVEELLRFLHKRNPFSGDTTLHNISTGAESDDNVNIYDAKNVDLKVLDAMKGENVLEYTFKKACQAVTMVAKASLKGEIVQVDPQLLLQRFIIAAETMENREAVFHYGLCTYPPSLFTPSGLMREAEKPALAEAMSNPEVVESHPPTENVQYVLDGGSLWQRIPWPQASTYDQICTFVYTDHVKVKYGNAIIVFDGYTARPSTKDATHERRSQEKTEATVNFESTMMCKSKKEQFLANPCNKQRFINLLAQRLQSEGCTVYHADGDADYLIVQKAVEAASSNTTVLVGEDTDLLVLLCHHASLHAHDLFFKSDKNQKRKKKCCWDIKKTKQHLGVAVCENLLFIHSVLGCDTTSRVHGIRKSVALKKFESDVNFQAEASVFLNESSTQDEVAQAGHKVMLLLQNGKLDDDLDALRHERFCQKVATSLVAVHPKSLPPTAAACRQHSLRVYLQTQQWRGVNLDPLKWGWNVCDGRLVPVHTELPVAPPELTHVVRCNCKTGCSCRKHRLECSLACGECSRDVNFDNSALLGMSEVLLDE
jgi:5'-3' exonuclease